MNFIGASPAFLPSKLRLRSLFSYFPTFEIINCWHLDETKGVFNATFGELIPKKIAPSYALVSGIEDPKNPTPIQSTGGFLVDKK